MKHRNEQIQNNTDSSIDVSFFFKEAALHNAFSFMITQNI